MPDVGSGATLDSADADAPPPAIDPRIADVAADVAPTDFDPTDPNDD
jgi:hypothetical protein